MLKMRIKCKKCKSIRNWHCLLCKVTFCYDCDGIDAHRNELHGGSGLILLICYGQMKSMVKNDGSKDISIYTNQFLEEWNPNTSQRSWEYKVNMEIYKAAIKNWLVRN